MLFIGCETITAQEVYNEVLRLATEAANDESKDMQIRLVNTFKYDALKYLGAKTAEVTPDAPVTVLDNQAFALYEFIHIFVTKLTQATNTEEREVIRARFTNASLYNPRFNDVDKDLVLAYMQDKTKYITQFSLDTDWELAVAEIKKYYSY